MRMACVLAGLVTLATGAKAGAEVAYTLTPLGTLGGDSSVAYGLNSNGQVVGTSRTAEGGQHAFLYNNVTMTDLGTLGGDSSTAYAINNAGQVVGEAAISGDATAHAFLYNGGALIDLTPTAGYSTARGINSSGQIVGAIDALDGAHMFLYSGQGFQDIGTPAGENWAQANAINATGQIVALGWNRWTDPPSRVHAFAYGGGAFANLNPTNPYDTFANAINDHGDVVGQATGVAFLYSNSTVTSLGTLGGMYSDAYGIDAAGAVVGSSDTSTYIQDAFIYSGDAMIDLNGLIDPSLGWHLQCATAINDLGQIAGYGTFDGQTQAFLLTPTADGSYSVGVPEPATLFLLGLAALPLMARRFRRTGGWRR